MLLKEGKSQCANTLCFDLESFKAPHACTLLVGTGQGAKDEDAGRTKPNTSTPHA